MRSSAWHPSSSLAEVQTRVSADGLEIGAIALYGNATERYNLGIVTEDELAAPPFQQRQIPLLEMCRRYGTPVSVVDAPGRSEEHTSELQSQSNLVCRLLLEKKNRAMQIVKHATSSDMSRRNGGPWQSVE